MLNPLTNREVHECIADILPKDALGEAMVLACYEGARDAFHAAAKKPPDASPR